MHQLPGCRGAAEAVRELPLRAGLKRCGGAGTLPTLVILSNCVECQGVLGDKFGFHG